ncbi:MAG: LCP family protein [Marmoricola sp.]
MTSVTSSAATADAGRARRVGSQVTRIRFRRAVALMVMTLLLPGSAQLVSGRRQLGRVALRIWFCLIASVLLLLVIGLVSHSFVLWLLTNTVLLGLIRFLLMGMAVGWAFLFVDAWRLGDPLRMRRQHRLAMTGINGVLCFSVVGTLLFASHMVTVQKDFLGTMFHAGTATAAHDGRYNILLLGGDSGADRWGLRPDSITLASIDKDTGKSVLFSLPRNMLNFTFPKGSVMAKQFPHGYNCNKKCLNDGQSGLRELNSLVTWTVNHKSAFKGASNAGEKATEEAVEGITGLKINYYAMINLAGFRHLVNAVGGIKLHVRDRIPIGGIGAPISGYVKPGYRRLNGYQALWFARSRVAADDYSRMARQKCVMEAMLHQVSPKTVMLHFADIAKASESLLTTDIPQSEVGTFMSLAMKARSNPIRTVSFVPPEVDTIHPDIAKIHSMVSKAISKSSEGKGISKARQHKLSHATHDESHVGGSYGDMQNGYAANQSQDLGSAC